VPRVERRQQFPGPREQFARTPATRRRDEHVQAVAGETRGREARGAGLPAPAVGFRDDPCGRLSQVLEGFERIDLVAGETGLVGGARERRALGWLRDRLGESRRGVSEPVALQDAGVHVVDGDSGVDAKRRRESPPEVPGHVLDVERRHGEPLVEAVDPDRPGVEVRSDQ